jgi:hypothetical protein
MVVLIQTFEFQCCVFVSLHVMIAWAIHPSPPPPRFRSIISQSQTLSLRELFPVNYGVLKTKAVKNDAGWWIEMKF